MPDTTEPIDRPVLCVYCKRPGDPTSSLPFFEYRGEGSDYATKHCAKCMYVDTVHAEINPHTGRPGVTDHPFTPRGPAAHDTYYCGCRGWD